MLMQMSLLRTIGQRLYWRRPWLISASLVWLLGGCVNQQHGVDTRYQSENQNARIRLIVLHYTTGNWQQSLDVLTKPGPNAVSAHYLIPESADDSYPAAQPFKVYQLVPEHQRAWHAGNSQWQQWVSVNDQSIGIELVNRSQCPPVEHIASPCLEQDFDPAQIQLLITLLQQILQRHPDIQPTGILAHSDVAPQRKQDPGSRFPWRLLAQHGIGAWYAQDSYIGYLQQFSQQLPDILTIQQALKAYGYAIELSGQADAQTTAVLKAFQRHFVQDQVTGTVQPETAAALFALLEKYYPAQLEKLRPSLQQ